MDPITHAVIGMTLSKISGHGISLADPVSTAIVAGAVFPDIDIVFRKWGNNVYLKNHRNITHSIFGLVVSAFVIAVFLGGIYDRNLISSIFTGALIGGLSHTLFDMLNSYGAMLLWPVINKKIAFCVLTVVDPLLFIMLVGYIFSGEELQVVILAIILLYLASRLIMRLAIGNELKKVFGHDYLRINILPSLSEVFKWHFVIEKENCNIVGEKNLLKTGAKHIRTLYKVKGSQLDQLKKTEFWRFFSEFTPIFHVTKVQSDDSTRYVFIDMRYYIEGNFLHHGILELDGEHNVLMSSFHPNSASKCIDL